MTLKAKGESPPSARRQALEILRRVEEGGAFASRLLDAREARFDDPRDAALLHEIVLGVLRSERALDHAIGRVASRRPAEMGPDVRRVLRIGAYGILFLDRVPDFAAVDTAVDLIKGLGGRRPVSFVNGVLRSLARGGRDLLPGEPAPGDVGALAVAYSHPEWWTRRVVSRLGWDRAVDLLRGNNRPAPTVLRPDLQRTTPAELGARLASDGIRTEPGSIVREAVRVIDGPLRSARAFRDGLAWVQDEGSQLVTALLGRVLRPRVADLCAAPGIKTMQLREALPLGGTIVAADIRPRRLERLRQNVARFDAPEVLAVAADMSTRSTALRGSFDHVLVDAPCSGTGTLRRHPEIRWRLRTEALPALAERQRRILETAASLLASGGSLLYAVCSMEPEEGEDVVAAFLAAHPEFRVRDARDRVPVSAREWVGADGALRTSPADGLDGFFAVLLEKVPDTF